MGDHLAVAVVNQRMRTRVEEQSKEIELVGMIGKMASSSPDLRVAFASAEKSIRQFVHFDRLAIADIDQEANSVVGRFELGAKLPGFSENKRLFGDGEFAPFDDMFSSGEPVQISHQQIIGASEKNGVLAALDNQGYRRMLYVPLVVADSSIGLMIFGSKSEVEYTDAEIAIAARIGEQVAGTVANSFLLEETRNDSEVESVLTEIGVVVGSSLNLQSTEAQLGPLLRKLVDANSILIGGITEDHQFLRMFYVDYVDAEPELGLVPDANLISLFPVMGTTTETVLKTLKSVVVNTESGAGFSKDFPGAGSSHAASNLKSVINVPLLANDQMFGFLCFRSSRSEGYSDQDLVLAEKIASQLASSVVFTELRRRDAVLADERTALISIGHTMGSALDLADVSEDFAKQLSELLPFDHLGLAAIDHSDQTVDVIHDSLWPDLASTKYKKGELYAIDGTVTNELVKRGEGILHSSIDSEDWEQLYPSTNKMVAGNPIRSMISVPLIWGDEVVAGLFVHSVEADTYDKGALQLMERVAAQIAGSVAGSLLRKNESEVEAQRDALERVNSLLGSAVSIAEVWDEFGTIGLEILDFDRCVVIAIEHDTRTARVLYDTVPENSRGREEGLVDEGVVYDLDGTVTGQITEDRQSLIVNQAKPNDLIERYEGLGHQGFKLPFLSNIGVPLIWGDKVVACVFFGSRTTEKYGDHELAIAERITAQIAGPIAGAILRQRDIELADEHSLQVAAEMETAVLAELSETKSNFIGAMSHELKTPLTSIVAFSDILSRSNDKELDGRPLQQIKVIQRNARHLEGMINELLDLSRMESGRFEILKSPFDFAAIVAEAIESSQPQLEAMAQTVDFQIAVDVLLVNGDRERLFQVITNLLSNASKYSPNDSAIEIEVSEDQRWLTVEVRDRGPGVPDDDPEALFAMFGRADNEITRRVPGTGIGLHVSKRIVDEHGGRITIKSRDGGGAVARFRIPLGVNAIS